MDLVNPFFNAPNPPTRNLWEEAQMAGFYDLLTKQTAENDRRKKLAEERDNKNYARQIAAKLKRDRQSYQEFRALDQQFWNEQHAARVKADLEAARKDAAEWREALADNAPEAKRAVTALRAAEDRAREAAEYAGECWRAYQIVRDSGTPQEATAALVKADSAREIAIRASEAVPPLQKSLEDWDETVRECRDGLAQAERELRAAELAARSPATEAPLSFATIRACHQYMQSDEIWETLSENEKRKVREAAEPRSLMTLGEWHERQAAHSA